MIQIEGLTKIFPTPDGGEKTAVDQVSFQVNPGEIYGLLGPNGAGKTTTLRMVSGLLRPSGGRVHIDGSDVTNHPESVKRQIGYLTANTGLYVRLTSLEMLEYFATLYGLTKQEADRRIAELVEWLGMGYFLNFTVRCAVNRSEAADQHCAGTDSRSADFDNG